MLTFWNFHESNILVMISHFSKICESTIVEIKGPSNLKAGLKAGFWLQIGIYSRKNCPTHGSGQIPPANSWWRRFEVFNVILQIKRHVFLAFLLLTLNVVLLGWVRCEQSYITAICSLTETRLHLKFLLGFSAEPIRMRVNGIQVE